MGMILSFIHGTADYLLSCVKLAKNQQVGWQTVDRRTGKYIREQQPIMKKIKLAILFSPVMEWVDTTHALRLWMHNKSLREGREYAKSSSKNQIEGFVRTYGIDMSQYHPSEIDAYGSFEDFFVRRHRQGSRPIHARDDPTKAVVVADCRVVVYETVAESKKIWIKGKDFSITNLVMDQKIGQQFADGGIASFRLSPQDYHRYHSPVTGVIKHFRTMPGDYYEVDPLAITSQIDVLTRNARDYLVIETKEFGDVLFVAIGATEVGTVRINEQYQKHGATVTKGDEIGLFQFGGSSIIVAFERGRIRFDDDLLSLSKQAIMVDVEVGMSLGQATRSGE